MTTSRELALKEMPSPKMQTSLAPEWYVKHYATIKEALQPPPIQELCEDEIAKIIIEAMREWVEHGGSYSLRIIRALKPYLRVKE